MTLEELKDKLKYKQMQKDDLQYKDHWSANDYVWNDALRDEICQLSKEIAERIRVDSAGSITEDGIFRSAVWHG